MNSESRYWLVKIGTDAYIESNEGGLTDLKTRAGRVRNADRARLESILKDKGPSDFSFVPTTYKPATAQFITPYLWLWMNRQQDEGWG